MSAVVGPILLGLLLGAAAFLGVNAWQAGRDDPPRDETTRDDEGKS